MACSHYVSGSAKPVHWSGEPHAVINLKLDFDGGITILTGASDIGQGSSTLLTQVVAEVLLLPMARIRVVATDSALTPKDNGSYSSRVSFMVGNAALRAAEAMKRVLVEAAARRLEVSPDDIDWQGESCAVAGTDRRLDFAQVVQAALVDTGTLTLKGTWSTPPETRGGRSRGAAVGSTAGFSYGAQVVEVEVDESAELDWEASKNARAYRVTVGDTPEFKTTLAHHSVAVPSVLLTGLPPLRTLYWKVEAFSRGGSKLNRGEWGTFTTPEFWPWTLLPLRS